MVGQYSIGKLPFLQNVTRNFRINAKSANDEGQLSTMACLGYNLAEVLDLYCEEKE